MADTADCLVTRTLAGTLLASPVLARRRRIRNDIWLRAAAPEEWLAERQVRGKSAVQTSGLLTYDAGRCMGVMRFRLGPGSRIHFLFIDD
eukprot:NODE_11275_length_1297_cov_4.265812.p3 GENE.NODE_11275_length_1297_cov_4.265812~~NODE_11275_length_1297_cov_4.265812.p3  ORF type:complete len:90 (+),score=19.93 NODE_11275_length_1297_cov_4.265812:668-937(+)